MTLSLEYVRRLVDLLEAETSDFEGLVKISGLDPSVSFRRVDLTHVDFGTADLSGYDFSGSDLTGANLTLAKGLLDISYDKETIWPSNWNPPIFPQYDADEARRMILNGIAPPDYWRRFIVSLDLNGESSFFDLKPLAKLVHLKSLYLVGTAVRDLTAISGLTKLQTLSLWDTQIEDITPLQGLVELENLYLIRTNVRDLKPIEKLIKLRILDLSMTSVHDGSMFGHVARLFLPLGAKYPPQYKAPR